MPISPEKPLPLVPSCFVLLPKYHFIGEEQSVTGRNVNLDSASRNQMATEDNAIQVHQRVNGGLVDVFARFSILNDQQEEQWTR